MDNHVHFILVPADEDGLRATLDDAHLMAAVCYARNNPVAARMVARAEQWKWSSARSHLEGCPSVQDPLTDVEALAGAAANWRAMLRHELEAGGTDTAGEEVAETIEARLRTGRPLAAEAWIEEQEQRLGRRLRPRRPGPKPETQILLSEAPA